MFEREKTTLLQCVKEASQNGIKPKYYYVNNETMHCDSKKYYAVPLLFESFNKEPYLMLGLRIDKKNNPVFVVGSAAQFTKIKPTIYCN